MYLSRHCDFFLSLAIILNSQIFGYFSVRKISSKFSVVFITLHFLLMQLLL